MLKYNNSLHLIVSSNCTNNNALVQQNDTTIYTISNQYIYCSSILLANAQSHIIMILKSNGYIQIIKLYLFIVKFKIILY